MKLAALMIARNDDWCIGASARMALKWADLLVVLIHCSQDGTSDIIQEVVREHPYRVWVLNESEPVWDEMRHRQRTLDEARRLGYTHMAIVDADEMLTANLVSTIRESIETTPTRQCLSLTGIQLWNSLHIYRKDGLFNQRFSFAFEDQPDYTWTPRKHGYQHHCRPPQPLTRGHCPNMDGGIFHLQFVRSRALRAKQAHYKMIEAVRWPDFGASRIDRKYNWWNTLASDVRQVPEEWWAPDVLKHIDASDDRVSWHEREMVKLVERYGRERFAGLDLFGII